MFVGPSVPAIDYRDFPDYLIGFAILALVIGPVGGYLTNRLAVGIGGAAAVGWLLFACAVMWY